VTEEITVIEQGCFWIYEVHLPEPEYALFSDLASRHGLKVDEYVSRHVVGAWLKEQEKKLMAEKDDEPVKSLREQFEEIVGLAVGGNDRLEQVRADIKAFAEQTQAELREALAKLQAPFSQQPEPDNTVIDDPEVLAIAAIVDLLDKLDGDPRERVVSYLVERYQ
jgi:hypothetical protein